MNLCCHLDFHLLPFLLKRFALDKLNYKELMLLSVERTFLFFSFFLLLTVVSCPTSGHQEHEFPVTAVHPRVLLPFRAGSAVDARQPPRSEGHAVFCSPSNTRLPAAARRETSRAVLLDPVIIPSVGPVGSSWPGYLFMVRLCITFSFFTPPWPGLYYCSSQCYE